MSDFSTIAEVLPAVLLASTEVPSAAKNFALTPENTPTYENLLNRVAAEDDTTWKIYAVVQAENSEPIYCYVEDMEEATALVGVLMQNTIEERLGDLLKVGGYSIIGTVATGSYEAFEGANEDAEDEDPLVAAMKLSDNQKNRYNAYQFVSSTGDIICGSHLADSTDPLMFEHSHVFHDGERNTYVARTTQSFGINYATAQGQFACLKPLESIPPTLVGFDAADLHKQLEIITRLVEGAAAYGEMLNDAFKALKDKEQA
jgi:hypothetical protein